jgi:E1A/CREB-binding protein
VHALALSWVAGCWVAAPHAGASFLQGIPPWDVPTAEGLTIRVINNVIKKCEVKQKFYDAFRGDGYAEAFIYRQRVVVLFQKIDGVDVALYCM